MLALAAPAFAHLTFVSMTPSGETELAAAPTSVVLRFDKTIGEGLREVTLTSPDGDTTELAPRIAADRATMALPAEMGGGLWRVEWSAIGADGHPQRDSRTFTIAGGSDEVTTAAAFPADAWRSVGYTGRALFFAGLLGCVGGITFAMVAARGFRPWGWGWMTLSVIAGAALVLASHAAVLERLRLAELLLPTHWIEAASAQSGRGYALGALLCAVAWWGGRALLEPRAWQEREGGQPWLLAAIVVAAAAMPTLSSHALASDLAAVRVPLDMVHVLAASIWAGGLVQLLALTVRRRSANPGIPDALDVYSFFAFLSVVTVVVTGTFAAIMELDANPGDLVGTTYGRLVLAKVGLLVLAAPLALANRRRHVPDVARLGPDALPALRRYVRWELVVAVWIVLATAALVHASPSQDHSEHGGSHAGHAM